MDKPKLCEISAIINSQFLSSEYDGKDWESVRKCIIKDLKKLWNTKSETKGEVGEIRNILMKHRYTDIYKDKEKRDILPVILDNVVQALSHLKPLKEITNE